MADPVAWGMIDNVQESIDKTKTAVEGIDLSPAINTVAELSDDLKVSMQKMVADVNAETTEMHNTIKATPTGVPAPTLKSVTAESVASGINVSIVAQSHSTTGPSEDNILSVTKGVMVRCKEGNYPENKEDGTLAFVDDDLFSVNASGERTAKTKQHIVVGLTSGKTYYFSAFPYSTQMSYNERIGAKNVAKCQWTGTKGTLTVTVTQDYDFIALGEITLTMTPTTGGSAVTKTRTGSGPVVFDSLEAGQYTLSFNAQTNFTKPNNQTITVTAGQPNTATAAYKLNIGALGSTSWELISRVSKAGIASKFFSVGDTKNITVNGEAITVEIVGFNHDNLTGGGKAGITFGMKHLMRDARRMNASNTNHGGWTGSEMCSWLTSTCYNGLPSELRSVIRAVDKKTSAGGNLTTINTNSMKIFLFSEKEVGLSGYSVAGEGEKYARFTSNSVRTKKMSNGSGSASWWWLRSPSSGNTYYFCYVSSDGSAGYGSASGSRGVCFGFCV